MSPQHVDEMLSNYKLCLGKSKHLEIEISILTKRVEQLKQTAMSDAALGCQQYSGMPHGSGTSDATGRVAVMFADGFKPQYITENEQDLLGLIKEKNAADSTVLFVEAWLDALSEKERFVVERKFINGESWRIVTEAFIRKYGTAYSQSGVKKITCKALGKIYLMAS